jgi:hypothetical protein
MARAQARAIVAVEIFVEKNVIAEVRVALEFLGASESRPPAMFVTQE